MKRNPIHWILTWSALAVLSATAAEPTGDQVLRQMSAKLAAARGFGFEATREIDASLLPGNGVAEKARIRMSVQRPNRLAASVSSKEGNRLFVADGRTLSLLDERKNLYATVPMRTSLDGLAEKLDETYGFTPPLVEFVVSDAYRDIRRNAQSIAYGGREKLGGFLGFGGVECHRVELKGPVADATLWIATGDSLPRKLVATFHRQGRPQVRANFTAWNLNAPSSSFAFTPPVGARKIEMWTPARMEAASKKP